jgi:hypothetical protein
VNPVHRIVGFAVLLGAAACGEGGDENGVLVTTVSEYGATPIAGVLVQVNDEAWASTDADGNVSFADIDPPYEVRVFQTIATDSHRLHVVWALIEQTSGRLIIPVDGSAVDTYHRGSITGTITGRSDDDSQILVIASTAPYGGARALAAADGTFELPNVDWEGPSSQGFTLQAFESDGADPPTRYIGHAIVSITLDDPDGNGASFADAELALESIDQSHVAGTVTMPDNLTTDLYPSISLEFADGSSISLDGNATTDPGAYDFAVPVLRGAAARIGFLAVGPGGDQSLGPRSYFERKVNLPADGINFDLPAPVELLEPGEGAEIGGSTTFRWSAVAGDPMYGLTVSCEWLEGEIEQNVNYRIIQTTETEARLPVIPGLDVDGGACFWSVGWFDGAAFGFETVTRGDAFGSSWSGQRPGLIP